MYSRTTFFLCQWYCFDSRLDKKILATDEKIKDEKLHYNINREAAKMLALSSGKVDKYDYLTGEEIVPIDQSQIVQQTEFAFSLS